MCLAGCIEEHEKVKHYCHLKHFIIFTYMQNYGQGKFHYIHRLLLCTAHMKNRNVQSQAPFRFI